MHHVSPTSKHNAHGADDALRNLNSATAKNDLLPPVSQRSQESSPFIALGDDLRRVRQEQPVPNAAHSLHYKHICRKTVATRCVSQEILYRLGLQTWVAERVLQQILGQCRAVHHDKRAVAARRTAMN